MDAIRLAGVSKTFPGSRRRPGRTALDGIDLEIRPGEFLALLGDNGSGKSTLLRIVAGLLAPSSGSVEGIGRDQRERLGVAFQAPSLDALLTIKENLELAACLYGLENERAASRIGEMTLRFGLEDRLDDRVATLSGGLRRRADLARALIHGPSILLLDEATAALDPGARRAYIDLIVAESRDRGTTVVAATHLIEEAERADRVVILAEGRVVADGSVASICGSGDSNMLVVRPASPVHESMLRERGLDVVERDGSLISAIGAHDSDLVSALTDTGAVVTIGRRSLAHAYLELTGSELAGGVA